MQYAITWSITRCIHGGSLITAKLQGASGVETFQRKGGPETRRVRQAAVAIKRLSRNGSRSPLGVDGVKSIMKSSDADMFDMGGGCIGRAMAVRYRGYVQSQGVCS